MGFYAIESCSGKDGADALGTDDDERKFLSQKFSRKFNQGLIFSEYIVSKKILEWGWG